VPFWVAPLLALAVSGVVLHAAPVAAARQPASPGTVDVRQLFLADCAVCHGSDGRGTDRGPSLVGVGRASLDYQLSTGRMPLAGVGRADAEPGTPLQPLPNKAESNPDLIPRRHAPAYPPETIAALVDYVARNVGGGGPEIPHVTEGEGNLAEGGDLFRLQCAACHAWAGDGGALVRQQAPAVHAATDVQVAEAVRVGPGLMPAFGDAALTEEQLASVIAYVHYLEKPDDRGGQPLWHLGPFAEGAVALAALGGLMLFVRWIGERG
jgi:ubiquinol-cytochrome c reductase cytochrome c subunit